MSNGTLFDSDTSEALRVATRVECLRSYACVQAEGHITVDGRRCYVQDADLNDDIRALRLEAIAAGDTEQVELCDAWLDDMDESALAACAQTMLDAELA